MRTRAIIIILAIVAAAFVTGAAGKSDDGGSGKDTVQQVEQETSPSETHTQEQEHLQTPEETLRGSTGRETEVEQHRSQESGVSETVTPEREQEVEIHGRSQAGTSAALLREHLQEQEQELELEHGNISSGVRQVQERHRNVSALVHVLQNESFTSSVLGTGPSGIGPQVSLYAREWNASLQAQIRAEERIQSRSMLVRFFLGGDREAALALEQESAQARDRIRQMQQLVLQCQACDAQVKALLEDQLRQMEAEQARIQERAEKEKEDTGLFGWIGR